MPQIIFENPNSPEQPVAGIYRWYTKTGGTETTIYVGCAGNRQRTVGTPSTLKRGIQEAQRSCVSSDRGTHLDTDFIVGTALLYFRAAGHDCYWQHVSNDPKQERELWERFRPLLQPDRPTIARIFRLRHPDGGQWSPSHLAQAERELWSTFQLHGLKIR